ncbi:MAG: peroxide stress protein YaaA [Bacteroidetes bacterium]|nr:peroxide stress protein YaaA [Bacteroidota bacterium]
MLLVISPAKTLDYSHPEYSGHTQPEFSAEVKDLVGVLRKKTASEISKLMHLSDSLASLNEERYKTFTETFNPDNSKQALLAFKGEVYAKMEADQFSAEDLEFAQQHLRILSGLYGVLKPLDLIQPYRLEMGTKLKTKKGNSLYDYWGTKISKALNAAGEGRTLVNLASQEYFKAVDKNTLKMPVITIHFKEHKEGSYQVVGFFAKQARGLMARYAILNRITEPKQLKVFQEEGYEFSAPLSTAQDWVFVR